jgi:uncharacterized protein YchJ
LLCLGRQQPNVKKAMPETRAGEPRDFHFRSDRFCQINGQWFFITREKTQEGPFPSRIDAGLGAQRYIARMRGQA